MNKPIAAGLLTLTCALVTPACQGADGAPSDAQSAKTFVQDFYAWYVKEVKKGHRESSEAITLRTRASLFSGPLVDALKDDLAASARSPEEVVGLDFDPFLNSQELCEPYKIGKPTPDADTYKVPVYGSCPDKPGQPDVIAALQKSGDAWIFVNFFYPGDGDLLAVLEQLKQDRKKPSH